MVFVHTKTLVQVHEHCDGVQQQCVRATVLRSRPLLLLVDVSQGSYLCKDHSLLCCHGRRRHGNADC